MDWQNVPLVPLLFRGVDAIIGNNNSGDTTNMWPNGTSLYMTMSWARKQGLAFPIVPSPDTMMSQKLNAKPAFYGCNATSGPLIIYIPPSASVLGADGMVKIGTASFSVESNKVPLFVFTGNANILRGLETLAGKTTPSNWAQCVACGVMRRQSAKMGNGTIKHVSRSSAIVEHELDLYNVL
jgi:lysophospholipase